MTDPQSKYPLLSSRKAAQEMDALIDRVNREDTPVLIRSKTGNRAVLISLDEFQFLEELLEEAGEAEEENEAAFRTDTGARFFPPEPPPLSDAYETVYQFKVTLKGIRPPIWRRIQVPENYTFWDLHVAIQDAMGWLDYHLHEFSVTDPRSQSPAVIGVPDEDGRLKAYSTLTGWLTPIRDYFPEAGGAALYRYDFGDDWQHVIQLEKIEKRVEGTDYPVCLAGKRSGPPEDCGGIPGYREILDILADPEQDKRGEQHRWVGIDFDPEHFEARSIYFRDPRQHLAVAFGDTEESAEEADEESTAGLLRVLSRKHLHAVWEKAKTGDIQDLAPEDQRTARIMLEHQSEFFDQFEFADLTYDHEYDPDTEVNPFLHIAIHTIVEDQLENRDPPEVFRFYEAMRKRKCSHHDAVHITGAILSPLLFGLLRNRTAFDPERYIALLKKYKNHRPEKIIDLLEDEPLLNDGSR
jgi:PHD/YefM family antitoxin component YafN of YafNO toxin-antitoxin module